MPHAPFVHLRVHSAYSMLEGTLAPKAIAKLCRAAGMPAVALTDRNNLFAAMEFSEACAAAGVQPIIGALLAIERPGPRGPFGKAAVDWLALLAQDPAGYANLLGLVSDAHLCGEGASEACLSLDRLAGRTEGLLCLTAGPEGALARLLAEGQDAAGYADTLGRLFPDRLYVELSRTGDPTESQAEAGLVALAHERDWPLVATNPVRFADAAGAEAQDLMLCIADGAYVEAEERRRGNPETWLKSATDMADRFADLPEAVANTLTVARRCAVAAPARKAILPHVAGDETAALREAAEAGLAARLAIISGDPKPYRARLDFELDVIGGMGFAGYFLIVADFIQWAKGQGIPVGPGRGSGAGSVVAWALTITDLDPLDHGLIFERFLNPERVSMPDFDIDFCETRRDEVIRYVQQRYGRDRVGQIITFMRMKARAVVKDVGRVLQMPYGQTERLAKLIPNHPTDPWTLARTLGRARDEKSGDLLPGVPDFRGEYERDAKVRRLIDIALQLENLPRNASTHAAGVVIGDRPLAELVPMYRDPRTDMPVTQFDMKWVEKAGLVKFDFLGLKTLSVLARAKALLAARGVTIDLDRLPFDDPRVYELLTRGDTVGVFQFESEGMRRALSQVKPDRFGDIVALAALYRPGPMDNIPSFANRKHGREAPDYLHPSLEGVLKETYGVIIYQEQVMQIAQILAGYSLGEADLLRRAMGKKIKAEMDAQKARFLDGAKANGIEKKKAADIFELVNKFAGYGFNKSHAAAYAVIAYQTAWLKAYHPHEFFAAAMAFDIANTDRLAQYMDELRRLGLECLPPCVNASAADFTVEAGEGGAAVRFALAGLKGVGEKAMAALADERGRSGPFRSLADFARRVDPRLLNKRQLESLIAAGAFDGLEKNRAGVYLLAEALLATAQAAAAARESAQVALFGVAEDRGLAMLVPPGASWPISETMAKEKEAFGFYFSGHPVEAWRAVADGQGARSLAAALGSPPPDGGGRTGVTLAALVEDIRWRTSPRDSSRFMALDLSDASGQASASVYDEEAFGAVEAAHKSGAPMLLRGELSWRAGDETPRLTVRSLTPLADFARRARCRLTIDLADAEGAMPLAALVHPRRGGRGEIELRVPAGDSAVRLRLGRDFLLDDEVRAAVGRLRGVTGVALASIEG